MPDISAQDLLRLLEWGVALCQQWEAWSDQQLAAVAHGDLGTLLAINTRQANLANQFAQLDGEWRRFQALAQERERAGLTMRRPEQADLRAELLAKRRELLAAVERVFAVNYRNFKALNLLDALGTTCDLFVGRDGLQLYNRKGGTAAPGSTRRSRIEREG